MEAREITEALNGLAVQTVGNLLGIKLPSTGMTHCPFVGHEDDTASFEVRKCGRRWICYGCNERGGAIDLVKTYRGLSFLEAKHWLAEKSGLATQHWKRNVRPTTRQTTRPAMTHHRPPPQAEENPPDHKLYGAFLASAPLNSAGEYYLQGRGLTRTIMEHFAIGQMPRADVIGHLIAEFSFARVEAAGLLTKSSTQGRYRPIFPEGALLFPFLEDGLVAYFQARVLDENSKGSRWRNLNHRRRRLYNVDVLANNRIRRVAICEGAIDVLSATQLGCEAIGLIGVTAQISDAEAIALRGRQVDLLLDWDAAGEKRATKLLRELARFGVAATRKSAPRSGATDVNEYLREGNSRL